jgi:hypothetical protein
MNDGMFDMNAFDFVIASSLIVTPWKTFHRMLDWQSAMIKGKDQKILAQGRLGWRWYILTQYTQFSRLYRADDYFNDGMEMIEWNSLPPLLKNRYPRDECERCVEARKMFLFSLATIVRRFILRRMIRSLPHSQECLRIVAMSRRSFILLLCSDFLIRNG